MGPRAVDRTARVLEAWAAADPGTSDEGLTAKQEIKAIQDAMIQRDTEFFVRYGSHGGRSRPHLSLREGSEQPPKPGR